MSGGHLTGADKLWADVAALDPADVCARSGARSVEAGNGGVAYEVPFMNGVYRVSPAEKRVSVPENSPAGDGELDLLLLAYLVDSKAIDLGGKWISEKEVPGGSLFFTGPHKMPLDGLAERYGSSPADFLSAGRKLGGTSLEYGDASIAFKALPRIPLAFVLWEVDDEFPAEVTVMFDESVYRHFPVDVILALVSSVVKFF